ncbi:MAG: hypothetical protein M0R80_08785 [Proteobacteria bacterium]|jgi:hypothetical protein|nr:hypothetical protein [Pseudomonadota bacterium]
MPLNVQTARQILNNLFQNIQPVRGPRSVGVGGQIPRGSIIRFGYRNWKHDPYPVVIVTDVSWAARQRTNGGIEQPFIKGINLNYLTSFDFQRIVINCGNAAFSYNTIMGDNQLKRAYRHYVVGFDNIQNLQMLNCDDIVAARDISRAYDPNQMDAIKQSIQRQLEQQVNIKAEELSQPQQQKFDFMQTPGAGQQMELPFGEAEE